MVSGSPRVPGVVAIATDRDANIYEGAAGKRVLGEEADMTADTVFAIFSTTKAIAGTAALQLMEDGKLDLDAPAKTYAPDIAKLQVLDGFDDAGNPRLRAPKRDITTRMLLLHTAGLGYDFFNEDYTRLANEHGQPSVVTASKASLNSPLLFDPGDAWEYGSNIDWVGQVIEGIAGKRLGEVCRERIFEPLGMDSTAFTLTDDMRARMAKIHQRGEDGSLTPLDFELPMPPEVDMGGHGLYGTATDYCKFIRMWLNNGIGPDGRVLKPETVEAAAQNGLAGDMKIKGLPAVNPAPDQLCRVLPRHAEELGADLHDQRRRRADRPTGRSAGLGRTGQSLLLDRPCQRYRRVLGNPDLPLRRPNIGGRLSRFREVRL